MSGSTAGYVTRLIAKSIKWLLISFCALALFVVLIFLGYDHFVFDREAKGVADIVKQGRIEYPVIPADLLPMLTFRQGMNGIDSWVVRTYRFEKGLRSSNEGAGQFQTLFWMLLFRVHYSSEDRLRLWAELYRFPGGRGLNAAASCYFSKPVNDLTDGELAALVLVSGAPTNRYVGLDSALISNSEKFVNAYRAARGSGVR